LFGTVGGNLEESEGIVRKKFFDLRIHQKVCIPLFPQEYVLFLMISTFWASLERVQRGEKWWAVGAKG
jgi:hypothetical protein